MQSQLTLNGLQPYLAFLGSFIQFGSSVLLVSLFLLLRRYARRRRYFVTWSYAWVALLIALFALMVRYNILPVAAGMRIPESQFGVRVLYFIYQFSKLLFYGLMVGGTLRFVRSAPRFPSIAGFTAFAVLYASLSLWYSGTLGDIVVWQTPVAVLSLGYASLLLARLPRSRRSLGSSMMASCFAFGAGVWLLYIVAFSLGGNATGNPLGVVVNFNTYLDLIWHVSLGFGMTVVLLEDVKHEVDAAHTELAIAHDNLRRASFYDSVTGSLNRQAYAEGLGLEHARTAFGSVVMLDMDNLKNINDQYGHGAGDRMLRHLVDVLRAELRVGDKLYRWGGDEFLLIFPGGDAQQVSRRMRALLSDAEPLAVGGAELPLSVSVGSAAYTSAENLPVAIDVADRAMYADKNARKLANPDAAQTA